MGTACKASLRLLFLHISDSDVGLMPCFLLERSTASVHVAFARRMLVLVVALRVLKQAYMSIWILRVESALVVF